MNAAVEIFCSSPELGDRSGRREAIPSTQWPTPWRTRQRGVPARCRGAAVNADRHLWTWRAAPSYGTACTWTGQHLTTKTFTTNHLFLEHFVTVADLH